MDRIVSRLCALAVVAALGACSASMRTEDYRPKADNPELLHRSVKQVTDVIVHDIFSPPVAARIYAYMSVAGYEAAIHENPAYQTLAGQLHGLEPTPQPKAGLEYCYSLASVEAVLTVGKALVFSEDRMDEFHTTIMNEFRDTGIPDEVFDRSVAYGQQVAQHILAWSAKDNYKESRSFPKYSIEDDPSTWQPTPPAYMDAVEPHWAKIRTMVIDSCSQFKPVRPAVFSRSKQTPFYNDAYEVYSIGKNLTEEQRKIAFFWDCNPFMMNVKGHVMFATKKISPGGHWMNITHQACIKTNAGFVQAAEAYAMVSVSLMDGFISAWDEKYRSKLIRPETYINEYIDEDWLPLLQTPPFPEYPSAHSVISAAASVPLTKLFGDDFSFPDSTETDFGLMPRTFKSFKEAAHEAGISRMYGGIHYRPAFEHGLDEGDSLGQFIVARIRTRKSGLASKY